jgi:hypothetical protein
VDKSSQKRGEASGREAILKRMVNFVTYKVNLEIVNIMYGLEDVSVLLHNTSQHEERHLDEWVIALCRLRGNQIYRLETFMSDLPMLSTFFV